MIESALGENLGAGKKRNAMLLKIRLMSSSPFKNLSSSSSRSSAKPGSDFLAPLTVPALLLFRAVKFVVARYVHLDHIRSDAAIIANEGVSQPRAGKARFRLWKKTLWITSFDGDK